MLTMFIVTLSFISLLNKKEERIMLLPVIMAGGSGSRLWPLSRTLYPKQFLALTSNATMLQERSEERRVGKECRL